ncbi:MAG: outer membrane protein assembly factor BamB [Gammaproteobacteria bacterium]|nr:outer membrane protein assembly factor BamB [Gammaproteobacteria bacterium]
MRWFAAGLVAATLLLSGCGLFGDKEEELEPMELVAIDETIKIKRIWTANLGGKSDYLRVALRPAGDGNRIYAASRDGDVSAFDPKSGKRIWRTRLDIELSAGPGVGEGRVVVAAQDGFAVALDAATGEEQWRSEIAAESLARPLIKDQLVIMQTIDNRLQALSMYDGRSRWSLEQSTPALTMRGSSSPEIIGTTVVAGFDTGRLIAADLETGTVIWESFLSPPKGRSDLDRLADIDGALAVVGQDLYATGYQGRLAALAIESGQVLWSREISSYAGVAADWNSLYTVRDDGEIIALTRRNGAEAWRNASLLRREPTLPIPFGTTVVVGDLEGYIHFFSTIDGEAVARERLGRDAITSDPLVIANTLYVQGDNGTLGAYVMVDDRPRRSAPDVAEDET